MVKRKSSMSYEENHKMINDIEYKKCSICNEWKPMDDGFYKNKCNGIDGHNPYCKECTIKKSTKRNNENREEYLSKLSDYCKEYIQRPERKIKRKMIMRQITKEGKVKKWQQENKDKVSKYNKDRRINKYHDITDQEWFECLDYFSNSCSYCGISEQEQFSLYNEQFHKEHVIHTGSNYIDNCVPACTGCNSSKHDKEFKDWYNKENPNFTQERLNRIVQWMTKDCFNVLNLI